MDPLNEIGKHLPEIANVAKVAAASIPFTGIVKRMLGPAADEVAEQLATEIKVYRYGRSLKLLEKAERMALKAGYTPAAVSIKLLFPLLEGASLEEDESLHDMWAALLANAASPHAASVRPQFISILRQMSSEEAQVLNWFSDYLTADPGLSVTDPNEGIFKKNVGSNAAEKAYRLRQGQPVSDEWHPVSLPLAITLNGLQAATVIQDSGQLAGRNPVKYYYQLTPLGFAFVQACRQPGTAAQMRMA